MNRRMTGLVGIGFLVTLVILVVALPVSGEGRIGPQDGTGFHHHGGTRFGNGGRHGTHGFGNRCHS